MRTVSISVLLIVSTGVCLLAQPAAPVKLNPQEAEALALKNHPQVLAAQHAAAALSQRVDEAKSAYYPTLSGDVTGSQGNPQARIGVGFLADSRLFDRFGQGITLSQLITDSGRTPNLVAASRLPAGAAGQTAQATRYDVLVHVNQAYFETLRPPDLGEIKLIRF
jgi:outer membrane protein